MSCPASAASVGHYFAGISIDDAAAMLGISIATAVRSWRYARAWLADKIEMSEA